MVDDSSNRANGTDEGVTPRGEALPEDFDAVRADADSILRLLSARLELSDLSKPCATGAADSAASGSRDDTANSQSNYVRTSPPDSSEMTPAPMVVAAGCGGTPTSPLVGPSASVADRRHVSGLVTTGAEAGNLANPSWDGVEFPDRQAEYHPPRNPPASIAPPPATQSFSVAPQYDPKAPTRPKVRRNTSAPPPPLLFGLDRMLVWGLVLGGFFVAVIVVLVHQLALPSIQREGNSSMGHPSEPRVRAQLASSPLERDSAEPESGLASGAPTGHASGSVIGPERNSRGAGVGSSGASSESAVARDSTNSAVVQLSEKPKPTGGGGNSAAPNAGVLPHRAKTTPRKSWIE